MLASRYGPQRAAWIAQALTPSNLSQQPVAPTPAGATPVPTPVFPAVPQRDSSWEKPALVDALSRRLDPLFSFPELSHAVPGAAAIVTPLGRKLDSERHGIFPSVGLNRRSGAAMDGRFPHRCGRRYGA